MAIIVKSGEKPNEIKGFPKLMKYKKTKEFNYDLIVLFDKSKRGMVINSNWPGLNKGNFSDSWLMDYFEDYNDPVVLQNA